MLQWHGGALFRAAGLLRMAVKIEQDADYQYFIVSTFNRKIDDDYQELADFLAQHFSEHFNFGFFLCNESWQQESRLVHYFKLSKQQQYQSSFSEQQIAQHETLIRHPLQSHLIRYCSHFMLKHTQINAALALNANQSSGRSFLYLQRKNCAENKFSEGRALFELSGAIQDSIDWNSLENALKTRQIFPLQKWQGCGELSIRLSNAAEI